MADGAIDTLAQSMSQNRCLKVRLDGDAAEVLQALRAIKGVSKVQQSTQHEAGLYDYELTPVGNEDLRKAVNAVAQANGWNIYRMESGVLTLEDVFLKVTMEEWQAEQKLSASAATAGKTAHARGGKVNGSDLSERVGSLFQLRYRSGLSDGFLSGIGLAVLAVLSELCHNRYE